MDAAYPLAKEAEWCCPRRQARGAYECCMLGLTCGLSCPPLCRAFERQDAAHIANLRTRRKDYNEEGEFADGLLKIPFRSFRGGPEYRPSGGLYHV